MAACQDGPSALHPDTNSVGMRKKKTTTTNKKNLADVCGDGSVPVEGNNFEEDESISK